MAIDVVCGRCGKHYRVRDEMAGKRLQCAACFGIIIPKAAPPSAVSQQVINEGGTLRPPQIRMPAGPPRLDGLTPPQLRQTNRTPDSLLDQLMARQTSGNEPVPPMPVRRELRFADDGESIGSFDDMSAEGQPPEDELRIVDEPGHGSSADSTMVIGQEGMAAEGSSGHPAGISGSSI